MAKLEVAPTKSNSLALRSQLAFAEEGYDLLEQKRQLLIYELLNRLKRFRETSRQLDSQLASARADLREASLDLGSHSLAQAALGVDFHHKAELSVLRLMGLRLPQAKARADSFREQFGLGGTSATADAAMRGFVSCVPLLAEMAELQTAMLRLSRELRKTQRRCNALSKIAIPSLRETITHILATLEERDRESFILLKMIRDRLEQSA